jgi:hypothetical protein
MAAGEGAKALRIHGALRASRTCGEVSDPIVGERSPQVKSDRACLTMDGPIPVAGMTVILPGAR